jgi:hypothetical protein
VHQFDLIGVTFVPATILGGANAKATIVGHGNLKSRPCLAWAYKSVVVDWPEAADSALTPAQSA